jgi:hypothetical protein
MSQLRVTNKENTMQDFPRNDNVLTNSKILARVNTPKGAGPKSRARGNWTWKPGRVRRPCETLTVEAYAIRLLEEGRGSEAEEILDMLTRG